MEGSIGSLTFALSDSRLPLFFPHLAPSLSLRFPWLLTLLMKVQVVHFQGLVLQIPTDAWLLSFLPGCPYAWCWLSSRRSGSLANCCLDPKVLNVLETSACASSSSSHQWTPPLHQKPPSPPQNSSALPSQGASSSIPLLS
jgi:hypothetical protein